MKKMKKVDLPTVMRPTSEHYNESRRIKADPILRSKSNEIDSILQRWKNDLNCRFSNP